MNFKKALKNAVVLTLSSIMVLSAATACGKTEGEKNETGKTVTEEERPLVAQYEEFKTDESIDVLCFEFGWTGPMDESDVVTPEIAKRTGLKMNYEPLTLNADGELNTHLNLMVADGDLPDVFFGGADMYSFEIYEKLGQKDKIWDLSPFLGDYKNLSKLLGPELEKYKRDGKTWFIPTQTGRGVDAVHEGRSGLYVRKDYMDKLGITKYPETLEEVETYIRRCLTEITTDDGQAVLPIVIDENYYAMDTIVNAFFDRTHFYHAPMMQGFYFDLDNNYKMVNQKFADSENLRNAMKWINRWYKEGIIEKEVMTIKRDSYVQKLSSARTSAALGIYWDMNTYSDVAKEIDSNVMMVCTPTLKSETYNTPNDFREWTNGISCWSSLIVSKEVPESKLRHFLAMLDYLATPEGQVLVQYGIEDNTYTLNDQGKVEYTEDFKQKTDNLDWNKQAATGVAYWSQLVFDINQFSELRASIPGLEREDNRLSFENKKALDLKYYNPDMKIDKSFYFEPGPVEVEKMPIIMDQYPKLITQCLKAESDEEIDKLVAEYGKFCKENGIEEVMAEREAIIAAINID